VSRFPQSFENLSKVLGRNGEFIGAKAILEYTEKEDQYLEK
jgi:hypothetical protein